MIISLLQLDFTLEGSLRIILYLRSKHPHIFTLMPHIELFILVRLRVEDEGLSASHFICPLGR